MKDNLSIIIAMLVFVILIVIFPLYNYFERQDDMSYNLALKATTNFVDEVLESGYLTQEMYNKYILELSNTGNIYDIQLEAHKKILTSNSSGGYDEQYKIDYNKDIFDTNEEAMDVMSANIVKDDAYYLDEGDQFYVKMNNSNTTMAGAIFNTIVPTASKERISVNYGGVVKNQAWAKVDAKYYDIAGIVSNSPNVFLEKVSGIIPADKNISSSGLKLFPNNSNYVTNVVFSAKGPENSSWWNKVTSYTWTLDGGSSINKSVDDTYTIPSLSEGDHTLTVVGNDEAGNKTDEKTIQITVTSTVSGSTGGKEFNGDNFDIPIPKFMNAYPKKITLDVYLGSGHGAYKKDDFKLYNSSKIFIQKDVGQLNTTTRINLSSGKYVNVKSSYNMQQKKFDKIESGEIVISNKQARLITVTLEFDYSNVNSSSSSELLEVFETLKIYYENNCGSGCYLNTKDDNNIMRYGVYNYDIEYTSI